MDSQIHQLLKRPFQCCSADICLISDAGAFTAGVQGIIGFLALNEHGIFSSQKLLTLLEYMIPCISIFQLLFSSYRVLGCWPCGDVQLEEGIAGEPGVEKGFSLASFYPSAMTFIPWLK